MRDFAVRIELRAVLDIVSARAFLGVMRAATLDAELTSVRDRLATLPESGHPVKVRDRWLMHLRRVILSRSPYVLYYRLDLEGERVLLIALRHERARPPKF